MRIGIGSDFLDYIPDLDTRFAKLKELGFDAVDFNMCKTDTPWYRDEKEMENIAPRRKQRPPSTVWKSSRCTVPGPPTTPQPKAGKWFGT